MSKLEERSRLLSMAPRARRRREIRSGAGIESMCDVSVSTITNWSVAGIEYEVTSPGGLVRPAPSCEAHQ